MDRLLLRPDEVQRALGLGRSKTYQMMATGELPVVRIGRSVRVPAEALRRWVEEKINIPETENEDTRPKPAGVI